MKTYGIFGKPFRVILGTVRGCNQRISQLGPMAIWSGSLKEPVFSSVVTVGSLTLFRVPLLKLVAQNNLHSSSIRSSQQSSELGSHNRASLSIIPKKGFKSYVHTFNNSILRDELYVLSLELRAIAGVLISNKFVRNTAPCPLVYSPQASNPKHQTSKTQMSLQDRMKCLSWKLQNISPPQSSTEFKHFFFFNSKGG